MFEIGNSLREARERQGLELAQLEAETKVRARYLRALEEERFDQLPAESYARGFLEVYATRLGLDGQVYVDEFDSRFARGETDDMGARRVRVDRRLRLEASAVGVGLLGILLVTVLVIAAWQFSGRGDETPASPPPAPAPAVEPPVPTPQALAPAPPAAPTTDTELGPPSPAPAEIIVEATLAVTALEPDTRVTVRRNGPKGRVIFAETLASGETQLFEGSKLHAAFRTPAAVEVSVNGERVDVVPRRLVATAGGWRRG